MLKFQRTKLVDVVNVDDATLSVHGILTDHIFGLEIDVTIGIDTQVIESIHGQWHREETPECSRAIPFLQEAVGLSIEDGAVNQKINKSVGRRACPHFANLLVECCDTAKQAILVIRWEKARAARAWLRVAKLPELFPAPTSDPSARRLSECGVR